MKQPFAVSSQRGGPTESVRVPQRRFDGASVTDLPIGRSSICRLARLASHGTIFTNIPMLDGSDEGDVDLREQETNDHHTSAGRGKAGGPGGSIRPLD